MDIRLDKITPHICPLPIINELSIETRYIVEPDRTNNQKDKDNLNNNHIKSE